MSVALCTSRLPLITLAPWLSWRLGPGVGFVHRRARLLDLEEQRIGAAAALEQHQVDPHPDAADPDHLADHVDLGEPVEQAPPVLLQGQPILGQKVIDEVKLLSSPIVTRIGGSSVIRGRPSPWS